VRGVHDGDLAPAITRGHFLGRMPESVAVPGLDQRDARLHRIERRSARRSLAAVVRHEQKIGTQPWRARDQGRFLQPLDVAGQERRGTAVADAQHAGDGVGLGEAGVAGLDRMQDLEVHAVPRPTSHVQRWPATQRRAARSFCNGCAASIELSSSACGCIASTAGAPPVWSLSRWLSSTVASFSSKARRSGTSTRWPASISTL
jgi:hypothetical protein